MQGPLARQVAKQVLYKFQPSVRPPLCSKCLQAIQIRKYSSRSHNTQRVKKTSSEFSSRDRYSLPIASTSSRSESSSTDARLKNDFDAVFNSPSSSSSPLADPNEATEVIYPMIFRRNLRSSLDPHLEQISTTLVNSSKDEAEVIKEEQVRRVTTILNHCWIKSVSLNLPLEQKGLIEDNYAEFIIRQALSSSQSQLQVISDILQSSLEWQTKHGNIIGSSLIGAWAVLRVKLAIDDKPNLTFPSESKQDVESYLREELALLGENVEEYIKRVEALMGPAQPNEGFQWTSANVEKEMDILRRGASQQEGLIRLWRRFQAELSSSSNTKQSITLNPAERDQILALFLKTFKRSSTSSRPQNTYFDEVLAQCPRPFPRVITQTLLALRAQPSGSAPKAGHDMISLDHEDTRSPQSSSSLDSLKIIWEQTEEKDLKMYMIYLEGLGRLGDLEGLKVTWNALVKDEKAKKLYIAEEKLPPFTPFPTTQALNQMISSCLLTPEGSPVALDLFAQGASPNSSIPINIITINTILRHHARQADLPSMSSLFTLAEKLKLKPDIITYTTLVQGLLRGGKIDLAKKVLEDMSLQGIQPNERMCSMLISDLSKLGTIKSLTHAEDLLKLMLRKRMKINEVTWTGLISGYFKGGWEKDGYDTINRMEKMGFKLNRIGYNICLKQFTVSNINSSEANQKHRQSSGQGQGIMKLWNKLLRDGITPNSDTYLLILTPLVTEKKWSEAESVLDEMRRRNFRVEKGALQNLVNRVKYRR